MKLTEPVYLATLPLAGTAVAYLFEFGFAAFHGIPTSFIQLSISQFVGAAVLGLLMLWAIHLYLALGIAFLHRRKLLFFKFIGLGMLYATLPFLLLISVSSEKRAWAGFAVMFLFPSVFGLVGALISKNKETPFFQHWWEQSAFEALDPKPSEDKLTSLIDKPQEWFALLLLAAFLSTALGYRYASFAIPSMVDKSDKSKTLVVTYGEKWFFRPITEVNQPRSTSKGELIILSGERTKELTLVPAEKPLPK